MTEQQKEILYRAIQRFGASHQITKAIEEMAELIVELSKKQNEQGLRLNLIGEIADASIMIDQLKLIFDEELVENMINEKMKKLSRKLDEDSKSCGAV